MLGQAADVDLHDLGVSHPADPFRGEDVDHTGREAAVGNDRDTPRLRFGVQRLLLKHDLGVAAQVGAVDAGVHRRARHREVEVVRRRVLDRVVPVHRSAQRGAVLHIEPQQREPPADLRLERAGDTVRLQVGDGDPLNAWLLQQIVGAGGPLQARAQNQHAHDAIASGRLRGAAAET